MIKTLQTNPRHREEELHKITRHQEDKQRKATSSLFPTKIIAKLEMTHNNVQQNMEQTQNPTMGAQSTTNQQQQNRRLRTTNPFLVICMEKQYSENVSIDAFDNYTRLKNEFTSMLNVQGNKGISFYIVSI